MSGRTEPLSRALFALLVLASFAAFFVTQRLKHSPSVVQRVQMQPFFSPVGIGHRLERLSFRIKRADDVTVTVVGRGGDDVATLARDRRLAAYTQLSLRWDGKTDAGHPAPDGVYRVRVRLRNQGRSVLLSRSFLLHATAPRPVITAISGSAPGGPAILPQPGGAPATISFSLGGGAGPQIAVYRTDVRPVRLVTMLTVAPGATSTSWDGTVRGRRVGPGTYLVAISDRDAEGNTGRSPQQLPPRPGSGRVPGHAGITVRYLGVQPPVVAVTAAQPVLFGVDARRAGYSWSVTRVGAAHPRARGSGSRSPLRIRAPGGVSALYVLEVRSKGHRVAVPFSVQGPGLQHVLVVLPAIGWLGGDPVDDDGDGVPNLLDQGDPVAAQRIFAGNGLPAGFLDRVAPLLAFLGSHRMRFDITTDLALARHAGVALHGHSGVLLAGDERWLPRNLMIDLRTFVRRGGRVASFGTDSLLRTVDLQGGELVHPAPPGAADAFGARLDPVQRLHGPVTDYLDRIGLFGGGGGQLTGFALAEPTQSVGRAAQLVASAVTGNGRPVVVAVRYGRGLEIRTGLPELPARLATPDAAALVARIWTLLSR